MKVFVKKSVLIAVILTTGSLFISCNTTHEKKENSQALAIHQKIVTIENVEKKLETRDPIVFITGYDNKNENFYTNAREYFKNLNFEIVDQQYSLEEIINWLNTNENGKSYGEIHIVNRSNPYKGMTLETVVNGEKVSAESLRRVITKGELPILNEHINANSKIILHANGIGKNADLMTTFKDAFYAEELPTVIASPYYSIFNGEFSEHYLAKSYHVFYPTANSPGKVDLSKEIARKYPEEKDINWYDALNNEEERYVGEAYASKFVIPVKFVLDFHNSDDEMPSFTIPEEVMDFIEQKEELYVKIKKLNIPLEKFRWSWSRKNSILTIKGSTTGITVLKPLIKPYGELEHITPDTKNKRLYAMQ